MGDQGFDDGQLDAAGGGGAHPRHDGAGQHVQIYGQIEVIAAGDEGIQAVQQLGQLALGHGLVQLIPDPQPIGAGEQGLGVGRLGHPEAGVVEGATLGGALLGDLEEGGAGARLLLLHPQVEVSIQVDDADPALARQMTVEAAPTAEGHLVAPAQHQREVPLGQQARDSLGQAAVGGIEIAVITGHITAVVDRPPQMPGGVGQQLANGVRRARGPHSPLVAAHPLVAGEAHQGHAGRGIRLPRLDAVVPAQGQFTIFRIPAPLPDRHVNAIQLSHGASPRHSVPGSPADRRR
ncbi:hypothetical protein D3C85_1115940 [compost metagenome]